MRSRQRLDAVIECRNEVGRRATSQLRLGNDGAHRREHVLDAMVELGNQYALLILSSPALGYIDVDTDHPPWALVGIVGNESSRLDPTKLVPGSENAILESILACSLAQRLSPHFLDSDEILWVCPGAPFAARRLHGPFRQTV